MKQVKCKCPKCGTEYLLGEIFIPNYLVGQPTKISRDITGKILYNEGIEQDNQETYTCDKCNSTFIVNAKITLNTQLYNR